MQRGSQNRCHKNEPGGKLGGSSPGSQMTHSCHTPFALTGAGLTGGGGVRI